jgi:hypothetical protein
MRRAASGWGMAIVVAALVLLPGCTPWVQPYEREMLADPLMGFGRDPVAVRHRQHVYDVREAARGATGSEGGGCGCN